MALIPTDLVDFFEGGVSILVGTRDASLLPEATRGYGVIVHRDRRRMTIFVPTSVSERIVANLKANGVIAVGFSYALDHKTVQVKGQVESVRPATDEERDVITRYHVAFGEVLSITGIPRAITRTVNVWPSLAITFDVTDVFHQTPGPGAGERIETPS